MSEMFPIFNEVTSANHKIVKPKPTSVLDPWYENGTPKFIHQSDPISYF